jgi:hypothetical protein
MRDFLSTASAPKAIADEIRALSQQKFRWAADGEVDRFAERSTTTWPACTSPAR